MAGDGGRVRSRTAAGQHSAPQGPAGLLRSPIVLTLLVVVVLAAGIAAIVTLKGSAADAATPVARSYLSDWTQHDFAGMARLVEDPPPNFVALHQSVVDSLDVANWQYRLGAVSARGSTADASFAAHVMLAGIGQWDYLGTVHLARVFGHWLVEWTPATIYRAMTTGSHLVLQRSVETRASILGAGGAALAGPADVVTVGLEGDAIISPAQVTTALVQAGIPSAAVATALKQAAAHPNQFVPVTDLSAARYTQVKPIIFVVPGTRFMRRSGHVAVTADLAAHVVGSVGPITADQLKQLGPPYQATDTVGQVGLEAQYERQLAGTPEASVQVVGADGSLLATPFTVVGKPGVDVQTTLDLPTEMAAEAALNGQALPVALVAIRASTGEVLAAVSRPDGTSFDRSLDGQYPPGSTFKVVTSTALLVSGLTPDSPTTCPKTLTVEGRSFKNFEGEGAANLSFLRAFAVSCNTAFITMAGNLTSAELIMAAGDYGFNATLQPGIPVFGGQIPPPVDEVEKVASAIGQGRVLASPLQMAGVAAAVDSGSYHAPRLVVGAPDDAAAPKPLSPPVLAALRTMMAAVVTGGTGTAANVTGGGQVYGKTGTAEFGDANPPMTHAWFMGFRGDIAFAIVVEGGGVGGLAAAPIAARFLRALGS